MRSIVPLALLALSACDSRAPENAAPPESLQVAAADAAAQTAAGPNAWQASPRGPVAEQGETGARKVLLAWAGALERRDFARADAQWGLGADLANSGAQFGRLQSVTVAFGDGAIEGGAGSQYYEVPLTLRGTTKQDGAAIKLAGSITVRRVNDVTGASERELRWHVTAVNLAG